jgi:predicted nucleic acid-binding protein
VIVVDISVWVAALRSGVEPIVTHLSNLLDDAEVALVAPVRIELLAGASRRDRPRLRHLLSALPLYFPASGTWARIDSWIETASDAGERFGFADLLIASIAADHGASLWSLDADFRRMARLGLIDLHETT